MAQESIDTVGSGRGGLQRNAHCPFHKFAHVGIAAAGFPLGEGLVVGPQSGAPRFQFIRHITPKGLCQGVLGFPTFVDERTLDQVGFDAGSTQAAPPFGKLDRGVSHIRQQHRRRRQGLWRRSPHRTGQCLQERSGIDLLRGGSKRNHRCIQALRQPQGIDVDPPRAGHIDHVQGDHQGHPQLTQLGGEKQVAPQVRRIDHHHHGIGLRHIRHAPEQHVDSHPFVRRVRRQRVGTRQINQQDVLSVDLQLTGALFDRDTGVVRHLLVHPGQQVEQRAFACIGVANDRDHRLAGSHGACLQCRSGLSHLPMRWTGGSSPAPLRHAAATARIP